MRSSILVLFALLGCTEEKTTLKELLDRPDSELSLTFGARLAVATVVTNWKGKCPVLPGLEGLVDGAPATLVGRGGNTGSWLEPRCEAPSVTAERMQPMQRGDEHRFSLKDRAGTVSAAFRRASVESDVVEPAGYPGPGKTWRFSWSGEPPTSAVFAPPMEEARVAREDGGFTVEVPARLGDTWSLDLFIPVDVLTDCSVPRCRVTSVDAWSFAHADGGLSQSRRTFGGD